MVGDIKNLTNIMHDLSTLSLDSSSKDWAKDLAISESANITLLAWSLDKKERLCFAVNRAHLASASVIAEKEVIDCEEVAALAASLLCIALL